jgi:hypothetical protein
MKLDDVATCVRIIAAHPGVAPRYGSAITDLDPALLKVLRCDAKTALIFEEFKTASPPRIWGFSVGVFVSNEFLRELKTPPRVWIGPELTRRIRAGRTPVLSDEQFRDGNSRDGLNLVVWEACIRPEDLRMETYNKMMTAFIEEHRGYLLNEVIAYQADSRKRLQCMIKTGIMLLDPVSNLYREFLPDDSVTVFQKPHILGVERKLELDRPGSWASAVFEYRSPKIGFSRSEQRVLTASLAGCTDDDLSEDLGISISAVKKTWHSIYDRVASHFLQPASARLDSAERGLEKKRTILAYVREHPEELRPVSRRLLAEFPDSTANDTEMLSLFSRVFVGECAVRKAAPNPWSGSFNRPREKSQ